MSCDIDSIIVIVITRSVTRQTIKAKINDKVCLCFHTDATETVVHFSVSTRLDYCNSIFFGLSEKQIKGLQDIQIPAACLVTDTGKYEHITPILDSLRWLPVGPVYIVSKLLITYKCLYGLTPVYNKDLLTQHLFV